MVYPCYMDYVYTAPSLSKEFCEQIIQRYDAEQHLKYQGVTAAGLDKSVKDTQDMLVPETNEWSDINQLLSNELQKHMKLYIASIDTGIHYKKENNYGKDYRHLEEKLLQTNNFMIQRYEQNKGKYIYHHDSSNESKQCRAVTYLWYLNDVVEGGETDFFGGSFQIKPETGKLLLFPACWCYPHRGNMPISSSKYIVTGWLYTENRKLAPKLPKISIPEKVIEVLCESGLDKDNACQSILDETTTESSTQDKRSCPTEEQKLLFDYFYNDNRFLFLDYKSRKNGESLWVPYTVMTYTPLMVDWLKNQLKDVSEKTNLDTLPDIIPFVISSFKTLVDHIKERIRIQCNFNIKKWYVLYNEADPFDFDYDICVQSDITTGISHISNRYKKLEGYQLAYFIEFTFHFVNKDNETKILTLKDISEPCIDLI